jgi:hypothetical protein
MENEALPTLPPSLLYLLSQKRHHLRNVLLAALGAALGHHQRRIVIGQLAHTDLGNLLCVVGMLVGEWMDG